MDDADPGPSIPQEELREITSGIARRMARQIDDVVDALTNRLAYGIDRLSDEPQLIEILRASVRGNVETIVQAWADHIPVTNLQPTTSAVEYARRLAQRGIRHTIWYGPTTWVTTG